MQLHVVLSRTHIMNDKWAEITILVGGIKYLNLKFAGNIRGDIFLV
jgi:hypothetical protein